MPVAPEHIVPRHRQATGHDSAAWRRCQQQGLDRELAGPRSVHPDDEIVLRRQNSGLAQIVEPVWEALTQASSLDQMMVLADPDGDVLWRHGSRQVRDEAERIGFVEGADWSEDSVGTNAISQALRTGGAAHLSGEDHFAYSHAAWTCMAAPIRHPLSGETLGILDVSGPRHKLGSDVVPMVQMSARLVSEILRHSLDTPPQPSTLPPTPESAHEGGVGASGSDGYPDAPVLSLRLLGSDPAFAVGHRPWQGLPLRMAEILTVLSSRERGWTASELAVELDGDFGRAGTVRTDMHRLRRRVGKALLSQPYRLADRGDVTSDISLVETLIRQQQVTQVLDHYRQPLLAHSRNERIQQWRMWLDREVEELVLQAGTSEEYAQWRRTELTRESELLTIDL